MKGLRTQESDKFQNFFKLVQDTAEEEGKVFFVDSGDGHDYKDDEMEGEDLFGWLVPEDKADEFEKAFQAFKDLAKWDDFYMSATWKMGSKVIISFT